MFNEIKKTIEWGHDKLTLETGKIARQADSTVIATYGETVVMAAVVFAKESKADQDFFPLTVNYQEKYYAGLMGLSIRRLVNVSFSVGRASLLKKPPGILPAA